MFDLTQVAQFRDQNFIFQLAIFKFKSSTFKINFRVLIADSDDFDIPLLSTRGS